MVILVLDEDRVIMTSKCYQIDQALKLIPLDFETGVGMAQSPDERIWIDVQGAEPSELEALLDQLEVKHLARRLCIEARERPCFYPLNNFILLVIPVKAPGHLNKVEHVTVLCNQNFLLTLRHQGLSNVQQISALQESADWLQSRSIAALVSAFMIFLSLDLLKQLSELREQVSELESRLEKAADQVRINELSNKRSGLLTLEAVINGQLPALEALLASDKTFFEIASAREYLASAKANVQSAERSLHWFEGRIEVIHSEIEMHSQEKVNRRLGRLTILSTIFMPITFLAGIWGMNFEYMPELNNPRGYWMALGFMALISTGMYFYFRRRDWFN